MLPIPRIIHDYNINMNGVDSFDQRRTGFDVMLRSRRNWMAIFQFLLDIGLVNTVAVARLENWRKPSTTTAHIRMEIAKAALEKAKDSFETETQASSTMPVSSLHLPVYEKERRSCVLCKSRSQNIPNYRARERRFVRCSDCNVYLCLNSDRNCYAEYHEQN